MAKRQTIESLLKEAVSVWNKEGFNPEDPDTPLFNLHKDPVTRILLGALNYQSNAISDDIERFREELAEECLDMVAPDYLNYPLPSIGMMQTAKRHALGAFNEEASFLDSSTVFTFVKDTGSKRISIPFVPLFSISVRDMTVRSVEKVARNRWRIEIEDKENASSLEGLSMYFPNLESKIRVNDVNDRANLVDKHIKLFADDMRIPVCNLDDFDKLPFVDIFMKGLYLAKNPLQTSVLQGVYDTFCSRVTDYCIVDTVSQAIPLPRKDGCILIDVEIPAIKPDEELCIDDIMINCVPVINVQLHSEPLTVDNPVKKVEPNEGYFLTNVLSGENNDENAVVLREVGTERMSPDVWCRKMSALLDVYYNQYTLMDNLLDEKITRLVQPFLSAVKQSISDRAPVNDGKYLVLKSKSIPSITALWLSTLGALANDLNDKAKILQCSSTEFDVGQTRFVYSTFGGREPITDAEERRQAVRYYQVSRDRIVSKYDLVLFCRMKLYSLFAVSSRDIREIKIYETIRNSSEGFYERILVVDIKIRRDIVNVDRASRSLDCMIKSRTMSTTPVAVVISEV